MNAILRKECRLLLPSWTAAMLLAVVPAWLTPDPQNVATLSVFSFGLGALLLGVTSFGREFSLGTLPLLLAQPWPRRRLWLLKVTALALAFALALGALCLSCHLRTGAAAGPPVWRETLTLGGLLALVALGGGLWTTLLLRQVAAAFWFTLLVPALIAALTARLLPETSAPAWYGVLGTYTLGGLVWARRMFLRAQNVQWTGGAIVLPTPAVIIGRVASPRRPPPGRLGEPSLPAKPAVLRERAVTTASTRRFSPLLATLRKELHLHAAQILFAGGLAALHLCVIVIRKIAGDPEGELPGIAVQYVWLLWFAVPLLVGSLAVAEERRLSTLETNLCLPLTRRVQIAIKFIVVLWVGVVCAAVLPWALEGAAATIGVHSSVTETAFAAKGLAALALGCAAVAALSFYASTLSRNTLQAMGLTLALGLALVVLVAIAANPEALFGVRLWDGPLVFYLAGPTLVATFGLLACLNYKRVLVGWRVWRRNGVALFSSLALVSAATCAIYHRAWEFLTPIEPPHGPARLSGAAQLRLSAGGRPVVLLPDGRLWVLTIPLDLTTSSDRAVNLQQRGTFIAGSNWVGLAATSQRMAAIQSDGSLWDIGLKSPLTPALELELKRIGSDRNWQAVAAGALHFLALKNDGTLWAWGFNQQGQLGDGTRERREQPIRIGTDSDWVTVWATGYESVAAKSDGSLWRWGWQAVGQPDGTWKLTAHEQPARWIDSFEGTFLSVDRIATSAVAVRSDGTLWGWGILPPGLVPGKSRPYAHVEMGRLGTESDWRTATAIGGSSDIFALKQDGSLWRWELELIWPRQPQRLVVPEKFSRHSDWVAVRGNGGLLALAADGSLWIWSDPNAYAGASPRLLTPSRKPRKLANLFE